MRLLLDTHVLLWALIETRRLDQSTRDLIESDETEVLFSPISILEIAIKFRLGRPDFTVPPTEVVRTARQLDFAELPVHSDAAALVAELPLLHRDPFDRLLVAQSIVEPATLCTADARLEAYPALVRRIPRH